MAKILLRGATIVNEGKEFVADVLIEGKRISTIAPSISVDGLVKEINCEGLHLLPGCIDDQVHFRSK